MRARFVVADLVRNPRRTLSTMIGVVLGVGLFCGVLFFVDGLSASMTQRAVAPLPIDMQRIVTERPGVGITLSQTFSAQAVDPGDRVQVLLRVENNGQTPANEVTIRSRPGPAVSFVPGSASQDTSPLDDAGGNPFAQGQARAGLNIGTIAPGEIVDLAYEVQVGTATQLDDSSVASSFSSRESVNTIAANQPATVPLAELADRIAAQAGVASAVQLSIADLGIDAISSGDRTARGRAKIFGFDADYAERDDTIEIAPGAITPGGAVVSAEIARDLELAIGDTITVAYPDSSSLDLTVAGVADLSRSRSLFSSRRGGDLETFIYTPYSVIVPADDFADQVYPAFERASAAAVDGRLKSPPIREVDITLERELLDADPASAVDQTEAIAASVMAAADNQDYILDNISNTLHVAADDAAVAKRLFVFLGVPGALLAAILAAYAGNVMAEAQRREQATLRIRGASRADLLRMHALRTAILTAVGAVIGLSAGWLAASSILGRAALERASAASLATSAVIGTLGGFLATGTALYLTGRRSIDREIHEDRALLTSRSPLWRRARLDIIGLAVVAAGTAWALRADSFAGESGSVYFGRSVQLNLWLLILPISIWIGGSLFAARMIGAGLSRRAPASTPSLQPLTPALVSRSLGRRPWAVTTAAAVTALVVAVTTSLAAFTASYDAAKTEDARYANGADIRITPSPTSSRSYGVADASIFESGHVAGASPVVYGLSNVILRSARTSDPANLVALDPGSYQQVAPVDSATAALIDQLAPDSRTMLVSADMADFLKVDVGDSLTVLLARATPDQVSIEVTISGLFARLPGFPDGADAVLHIDHHTTAVPTQDPDLFFAAATALDETALDRAVAQLSAGPAAGDIQVDTRLSTLDRDQSSLAALNIAGLVDLDAVFALAMATVAIGIFVFGLLLQRRREYVTLRAQGLDPRTVRLLIAAEAATAAVVGIVTGLLVGAAMGYYFVAVLRPLFVLDPGYTIPVGGIALPVILVVIAAAISSALGSKLVNGLKPTELLRDE